MKKSRCFPFPSSPAPAGDEEQTALVPPAAGEGGDEAPCKQQVDDGSAAAADDRRRRRRRRGGAVAVVMGGLVLLTLLVATRWIDIGHVASFLPTTGIISRRGRHRHRRPPRRSSSLVPIPFSCGNDTATLCHRRSSRLGEPPSPAPSSPERQQQPAVPSCPDYFRYIHSDLEPWRVSGITREAVERGRSQSEFRLTVVAGRAYVETYRRAFQTRDVFTQWGILQLLARYPGRVPDLDLMFNCGDIPEVRKADYRDSPAGAAPPLFRYCKDDTTLDVLFPDWSFWGWPEVNIRPWAPLMEEMARENARLPWHDREPYAFWKGNPSVSAARGDLFRCNNDSAAGKEWKARLFRVDWDAARRNGFKGGSNLAEQCRYRYKIYVQGRAWSVSEKYILACDSPMLAITTPYKDFFSRGLVAGRHYWPIDPASKCRSVKFAVEWGDAHPASAQAMGQDGSGFAREDIGMDYVYDYMLHVLTEYAALLRYRPTVPEKAVELCPESMACPERGLVKEFMMESRERYVAGYEPCTLPVAFTAEEATEMAKREDEVRARVHNMEIHQLLGT